MLDKKHNNELLDILKNIDLSGNKSFSEEGKTKVTKSELKQNIYDTESFKKSNYINLDDEIAKLALEIENNTTNSQFCSKNKISKILKIKKYLKFIFKYIASSAFIFVMLLIGTNYSAYTELAKNYINPNSIKESEKLLYSSILDVKNENKHLWEKKETTKKTGKKLDSKNINNIKKESIEKRKKFLKEKMISKDIITIQKNKVFHSVDKLAIKSNKEQINLDVDIVPFDNRIIIPKLGKNVPLIDVKAQNVTTLKELEKVFMNDLSSGVVRYPGSAKPGKQGNVFIFGHSSNFPWVKGKYNDVFVLLNNLNKGDEIITYYKQKKYVYKVTIKSIINPGEVGILKRNKGKKELTLMTCWPIGTTLKRKIIIAELVENKK